MSTPAPTTLGSTARIVVAVLIIACIAIVVAGARWFTRPRPRPTTNDVASTDSRETPTRETTPVEEPAFHPRAAAPVVQSPIEAPINPTPTALAPVDEIASGLAQAAALGATDPAEARRFLEQLASRFPRNERILTALAMSLDGSDDVRARTIAQRCLEVNPTNVRCNTVMFTTFARAGDYDAGIPYVNACISTDATDTHCILALLEARVHRGELEEARAVSDRLREQTDGGLAVYATAQLAEASGQGADALRAYRDACSAGVEMACARATALAADAGR